MTDKEKDIRDAQLKKKYTSGKVLKRILADTKPIAWALIVGMLLSIISVSVWLIAPEIVGRVTDLLNNYYTGAVAVFDVNALVSMCVFLACCYVMKALADVAKMILLNTKVTRRFTAGLRVRLSEKIMKLPVSYIDTTPYGELISRMMNDVSRMGNTIHSFINMAIMGICQLTAITVLMYMKNWILATICLGTLPVSVLVAALIATRARKHLQLRQRSVGKLYSHVEEHYAGFSTIKVYNQEGEQAKKNDEIVDTMVGAERKGVFFSEIVEPVITFANNICFVVICVLGGYFALNNTMGMTVGTVVSVIMYAKLFANPLASIAFTLSNFQRMLASARRVYDVFDTEEMTVKTNPEHFGKVDGNVEFEHIEFSYTDKPLIKDLSFKVKSGQKVAIVGPTGGGKTTIVNLLMRFYDIKKGRILIEGKDIMDVSREELREQFSMVLQDTWLFNGTIMENIAYGKDGASDEEVMAACDAAYCDHFIRTLSDGYQTVVHNDITSVSAGQKQLLTIARAFLANRRILILDEATSNIDTRTEILIQKAMDKLMKDRTSFVIAHRLSTIVDADLILVINNGDIVETGTHKELMEKGGFYKQIYLSQYSICA
ncbi:MAG: ABC transporter ATP-binding protein [Clostridia bacterium]|nr:ABC transporter ATP-binding protein [Clostridia bacterium]